MRRQHKQRLLLLSQYSSTLRQFSQQQQLQWHCQTAVVLAAAQLQQRRS
jgi:hypothetical protein